MRHTISFLTVLCIAVLPATSQADGLIHQLPDDGAWVRLKVEGQGLTDDGTVTVTVKGTQTLRSIGRVTIDNQPCRWIELETKMTFERTGNEPGQLTQILKLLIPEKYLAAGQNPREHVLKAYNGKTAENLKELDLKGNDRRAIESLDEVFHAPLKKVTKLPAEEIRIEKKDWTCAGIRAESSDENGTFTTETRLNKKVPFGVVTYEYEKQRRRGGKSQGSRSMKWKLVESGKDAKSTAPDAR